MCQHNNSQQGQQIAKRHSFTSDGLKKRLADERLEFYLELRKAVIREFWQYKPSEKTDIADLFSNVLYGMDECCEDYS